MQKKRSQFAPVLILLISLVSLFLPKSASSAATVQKDFTVPASYSLGVCQSAVELDCIESVGLVDAKGVFTPSTLVGDLPLINSYVDPNGNKIYDGVTNWDSAAGFIQLGARLDSPVAKGCNGTCAALRFHVAVTNPLTTKVRFAFRTSWLKPMNIQMKALDSDYTYQKISGGVHWTMEGKGMPYSDYMVKDMTELNLKKASGAKADVDSTLFDFYIHHAGIGGMDSYWEPICADVGFSVQSHNTNETGDPQWDPQSQSLIFSIWAPHAKANGELNTGYFKFWTSDAFMNCKFPTNTLTKAAKLTIEIVNEDGTQSVATTGVSNKNGILSFFASGFHFSSPKILIKAEDSPTPIPAPTASPTPTASPSPMPTTVRGAAKTSVISCVKGKTIKRVSGINPVCPSGYKKRLP